MASSVDVAPSLGQGLMFLQEGPGQSPGYGAIDRRRMLLAAGARWRFDRPIRARRIPGYHSGPVEALDALEARFRAPQSGTFRVRIGS